MKHGRVKAGGALYAEEFYAVSALRTLDIAHTPAMWQVSRAMEHRLSRQDETFEELRIALMRQVSSDAGGLR